ncbi:MAG: hypothetical protein VYE64_12610 [Planctomycetota bacterium]|nr:hypothetical protein [Planctomycetota bacterium]
MAGNTIRSGALIRFGLLIAVVHGAAQTAPGQQDEMEIIERVAILLDQLKSPEVARRDKAQAEILTLGPVALDQIELDDNSTTDFRTRVAEIRKQLEKEAVAAVSEASRVTLSGEMSVDEALAAIAKQTGNQVQVGVADAAAGKKMIRLNLTNKMFWESLGVVMEQGGLVVDKYGGGVGRLSLAQSINSAAGAEEKTATPSVDSRIFRIEVARVDSSVNMQEPNLDYTTVSLLVRWEPRLRPISVDMPMASVAIRDEFGDIVSVTDPKSVIYGMIQPELPELEFALPLKRVDRQVEELQSLQATIDAVLPGRLETFRFRNLKDQKVGREIQKAGATVTYGGISKNEDVYTVTLSLAFEEENNALESHQGWVFQNPVYLENDEGEREEAIGLETLQQDNSKVTIRYLFIEDPGHRTLVYQTPAAIVKMPVKIELKKIPLP